MASSARYTGRKVLFGSHSRFCAREMMSRFETLVWFLTDAYGRFEDGYGPFDSLEDAQAWALKQPE